MHAALWRFTGDDADALVAGYDALIESLPKDELVHLCLRTPDGFLVVDVCPTREAFEAFATSEDFRLLRERHGIPEPAALEDYPVHMAWGIAPAPAAA
jgi:hypothetical protein